MARACYLLFLCLYYFNNVNNLQGIYLIIYHASKLISCSLSQIATKIFQHFGHL